MSDRPYFCIQYNLLDKILHIYRMQTNPFMLIWSEWDGVGTLNVDMNTFHEHLGHEPKIGEAFEVDGHHLIIIGIDHNANDYICEAARDE